MLNIQDWAHLEGSAGDAGTIPGEDLLLGMEPKGIEVIGWLTTTGCP